MDLDFESIKTTVLTFVGSKSFIMACGVFFGLLFLRRLCLGLIGFFGSMLRGIAKAFSPLAPRRVIVNTVALIAMMSSFSMCAGATAKVAGRDGTLEAIIGGSIAVGIWSVVLLLSHVFSTHQEEKKSKPNRPTLRR